MYRYHDFIKGLIIAGVVFAVIVQVVGWIAHVQKYSDVREDAHMITCQQAGYTYGVCFNVIHGSRKEFPQ